MAAGSHLAGLWLASRRTAIGDAGRQRTYLVAAGAFAVGLIVASILDLGGSPEAPKASPPRTTPPAARSTTNASPDAVSSALPLIRLAATWTDDCPAWHTEIGVRNPRFGGGDAMALFRLVCDLSQQRGVTGLTVACVQYPVEHPFFGRPSPRPNEPGTRHQGQWRNSDGRSGAYIEYYRDQPSGTARGRAAIWLETTIDEYPVALVLAAPPESGDAADLLRHVLTEHEYQLS